MSIVRTAGDQQPRLTTDDLLGTLRGWPRSIKRDAAEAWIAEATLELGNEPKLQWLCEEVGRAYGAYEVVKVTSSTGAKA